MVPGYPSPSKSRLFIYFFLFDFRLLIDRASFRQMLLENSVVCLLVLYLVVHSNQQMLFIKISNFVNIFLPNIENEITDFQTFVVCSVNHHVGVNQVQSNI